ncbi:MAG: YqaE/Pmp3 family membrane protein [Adhaeribacter sp.]
MKKKNLLHFAIVLFTAQVLFSCSSAEYYRLAPSNEKAYQPVKAKPAPVAAATTPDAATAPLTDEVTLNKAPEEPVLEANIARAQQPIATKRLSAKPLTPAKNQVTENKTLTPEEAQTLALVKDRLAHLSKAEKKELKTNIKEVLQQDASGSNIVEIIFAILIPPVGVFLHEGINNRFWISLLLTILFFIPGMIYALLVVTDTI